MSWKNIKTFMIILLLIACIIVGSMLWLNGDNEPYTMDSLEKAAKLMADSGIILEGRQLLGNFDGMKLFRFTLPQDYPEKVAERLTVGQITDVFTVPDGVAIRTDKGESLFIGSDFTINYRSLFTDVGFSESEAETLLAPTCQSPEFGMVRNDSTQNAGEVVYTQTLGDMPIPENQIKCNFVDGRLTSFEGKWCFPDKCSAFSAPLRDYLNIMFIERERVNAENTGVETKKELTVKELEKCYGIESNESKTSFILIPSLNIIYREGERAIHSAVAY